MADLRALEYWLTPYATRLVALGRMVDPGLQITSVRRSYEEQSRLYLRYLRGESGGIPAAPPGHSFHELGLAFDLARPNLDPFKDPLLPWLGRVWNLWGGLWKTLDPVHFQV